jgi:peptidase M23-like protein/cell shape-determining metallopeptidase Csd3-like protein
MISYDGFSMKQIGPLFLALGLLGALPSCKRRTATPVSQPEAVVVSSGTIGEGGSLSDSLGQSGVIPLESAQVERTLRPLFNPRYSKSRDKYEIVRSTAGHFIQMTYWPNSFQFFTVTRSSTGVFAASVGKVGVENSTVGVSGQIQGSLWDAMTQQGVPPEMIVRFAELFSWRIDFLTEPRVGDTYKMVWNRSHGNGAIRDDQILCASYTSREKGALYAYPLAGEFFDADGNSLKGEFLRAPLVYRRISSYFTEHRFHPILRIYRPHHGIDYAAPAGTPASSIADGVVVSKGWEGGLGNALRVRHSGSYVSLYGHLRGYSKGIHVGAHVRQGQVIGYVGSTGLSTGPHLHFGFERDGRLINFFRLKMKNSRKHVPLPERDHFEQIKKDSQALLAQLIQTGAPLQTMSLISSRK